MNYEQILLGCLAFFVGLTGFFASRLYYIIFKWKDDMEKWKTKMIDDCYKIATRLTILEQWKKDTHDTRN